MSGHTHIHTHIHTYTYTHDNFAVRMRTHRGLTRKIAHHRNLHAVQECDQIPKCHNYDSYASAIACIGRPRLIFGGARVFIRLASEI